MDEITPEIAHFVLISAQAALVNMLDLPLSNGFWTVLVPQGCLKH